MKILVAIVAWLAINTFPAQSHEFWLSMLNYQVQPDQRIVGQLLVGSDMKGDRLPYLPDYFKRFDIVEPGGTRFVKGRIGDDPAINIPAGGDGLAVLVYESGISLTSYDDWEVFLRFLKHKAFANMPEAHLARGLPQTGFSESYRRFAKALVAVGSGAGADRPMGMYIEIVALANPYTDDVTAGLPMQVLLKGQPRSGVQLEIFEAIPGGGVEKAYYTTDARGIAVVKVRPGREYLADNVILEPLANDNPAVGPVWYSAWASLTFRMPG